MEDTRWTCVLSLGVSLLMVWLHFGFPPLGHGFLPAPDGSALNAVVRMVAIPLTLAILAGGGLAAAGSLASGTEVPGEGERHKLALLAPAGVVWVVFVSAMTYPLGPIGNIVVVCVSALAILRILQNAVTLGVFRRSYGSDASAAGQSLGSCPNP
jgi:hypothetical protein